MRFACDFCNPLTDEWRTIVVQLNDREVAAARVAEHPELFAAAYALRRGYREAPRGFLHDSVRPIWCH
jgi:predicted dithiol-disulfide oxidoreductase (DUF899 family)